MPGYENFWIGGLKSVVAKAIMASMVPTPPITVVEVLGGGAPTLLRASEFLFVETRLV